MVEGKVQYSKLNQKERNGGGKGKSRGGESKGSSMEGAGSWKKEGDGGDVYIGH